MKRLVLLVILAAWLAVGIAVMRCTTGDGDGALGCSTDSDCGCVDDCLG